MPPRARVLWICRLRNRKYSHFFPLHFNIVEFPVHNIYRVVGPLSRWNEPVPTKPQYSPIRHDVHRYNTRLWIVVHNTHAIYELWWNPVIIEFFNSHTPPVSDELTARAPPALLKIQLTAAFVSKLNDLYPTRAPARTSFHRSEWVHRYFTGTRQLSSLQMWNRNALSSRLLENGLWVVKIERNTPRVCTFVVRMFVHIYVYNITMWNSNRLNAIFNVSGRSSGAPHDLMTRIPFYNISCT